MRFTAIATLLMIGATIGVTPGLRMDLAEIFEIGVFEQEAADGLARQRLASIPRQVISNLPSSEAAEESGPEAPPQAPVETSTAQMTAQLNALEPAAGVVLDFASPDAAAGSPAAAEGASGQLVASLPPSNDPMHQAEIFRLSDLAPAARPDPALPETDEFSFAVFVAIGSYEDLDEATATLERHAKWDPMIHKAVMNERMRHVVVLGPFLSRDVGEVLARVRKAGIDNPWPLAVRLRPGLSLKTLDLLG